MKISVVIATKDRLEDLKRGINQYKEQTYKNIEIIVVDNASNDDTPNVLPKLFPDVKYLYLPDNIDIRAINLGITMASGDIIWRCDDDSNPLDNTTFQRLVNIFETQPDIDIISAEIIEVNRDNLTIDWYPLKVDKTNIPPNGYKAHMFMGAGAAIRKKVFDKIGYFWEFGYEEQEFCTRALKNGFQIRYFPNIVIYHYASKNNRINYDRWIKISCQFIRLQWKYFPFFKAVGRTTIIMLSQLIMAIKDLFNPFVVLEGYLMMCATIIKTYRSEREPLTKQQIYDVTLGVSFINSHYVFFKQKLIGLYRRWKKK